MEFSIKYPAGNILYYTSNTIIHKIDTATEKLPFKNIKAK